MPKPEGELPRVLAILDVGLQSTAESAYGTDVLPNLCARCQGSEPTEGDLCRFCRAYLLGDSDVDPRTRDRHGDFMQTLIDSLNRPVEYGARRATQVAGRFHATSPIRVQRLDRDGVPTGEPEELSGYVVHHLNRDARDNRMENLRIMPARENVARIEPEADYTISWRNQGTMILWEYTIDGQSGAYLTDDRRGFTVRPFTDGNRHGGELLDADGYVRHFAWHEDYLPELADAPHPAAFRVATSYEVPEYYAVTCVQCRSMYAVDPERCTEGRAIMAREGHGLGGWCTALEDGELRRDYYVDGHGDVHTRVSERRDWLAETLTWLRQIVNEARQRLGL